MNEVRRILLLRPDKAGDAIKTLPALRALRALDPKSEIHVLTSAFNDSLFSAEPGITRHTLPSHWEEQAKHALIETLKGKGFPAQFDTVLNLLCDRSLPVERLCEAIPAKLRLSVAGPGVPMGVDPLTRVFLPGSSPKGRDESLNIALLMDRVQPGVTKIASQFPKAPILTQFDEDEAHEKMGRKEGTWLGFCPFAGTDQRSFPFTRFRKFIRYATRRGNFHRFFLFGTTSHHQELLALQALSHFPERTEVCYPSSFRALGAYLKRLDAVVAIDSGPLHYARALDVPSLGFLSGGDAERWFPELKSSAILRRGIFSRYPSPWEMDFSFRRWVENFA